MEILGKWHAFRTETIRTKYINIDTVAVLEMHETLCEKNSKLSKFYTISIKDTYGLDSFVCYVYYLLKAAWEDWDFMVEGGHSCPLTHYHETDVVISYITGEILEYSIPSKEKQLDTLAENLYDMWGYQPVSHRWKERLNQMGVTDFQIEDGKGYVSVFWNEENEFCVRQYGF